MQLEAQEKGGYRFLSSRGAFPFSMGVVADPGYEIVHARFRVPVPFRAGFDRIAEHLAGLSRPRTAFCAAELRCARPYTAAEFGSPDGFNDHYVRLLSEWGLVRDGHAAAARTNVAPVVYPPSEQVVFAFCYSVKSDGAPVSFVVSGATEGNNVAPGDRSAAGLTVKTANVLRTLDSRMEALDVRWTDATAISVYAVNDMWPSLQTELFAGRPAAAQLGVHWFATRPPIVGLDLELDVRGVRNEIVL